MRYTQTAPSAAGRREKTYEAAGVSRNAECAYSWLTTCWGYCLGVCFFFFNDTATTEIYTLSLHDALPICWSSDSASRRRSSWWRWSPPTRRCAAGWCGHEARPRTDPRRGARGRLALDPQLPHQPRPPRPLAALPVVLLQRLRGRALDDQQSAELQLPPGLHGLPVRVCAAAVLGLRRSV